MHGNKIKPHHTGFKSGATPMSNIEYPDYVDIRRKILSEAETLCRKCGDRHVDAGGKLQCRRPDCPVHNVRKQAQAINSSTYGTDL